MSVHLILVAVVKRIEKMQWDFLWGDEGEGFSFSFTGVGSSLSF